MATDGRVTTLHTAKVGAPECSPAHYAVDRWEVEIREEVFSKCGAVRVCEE